MNRQLTSSKAPWRYLIIVVVFVSFPLSIVGEPLKEEVPPQHTSEGYQKYPSVDDSVKLGIGIYWKRFISSFSSPDVPVHHDQAFKDEDTFTWIGQSTLIIKINGVVILTDPYLATLASPVVVGPERFVPPGFAADE